MSGQGHHSGSGDIARDRAAHAAAVAQVKDLQDRIASDALYIPHGPNTPGFNRTTADLKAQLAAAQTQVAQSQKHLNADLAVAHEDAVEAAEERGNDHSKEKKLAAKPHRMVHRYAGAGAHHRAHIVHLAKGGKPVHLTAHRVRKVASVKPDETPTVQMENSRMVEVQRLDELKKVAPGIQVEANYAAAGQGTRYDAKTQKFTLQDTNGSDIWANVQTQMIGQIASGKLKADITDPANAVQKHQMIASLLGTMAGDTNLSSDQMSAVRRAQLQINDLLAKEGAPVTQPAQTASVATAPAATM